MRGPPTNFWGKLSRDESGAIAEWHPLADHCCDVGVCCEALLRHTILRQRLARLVGWQDLGGVHVARLAVLAALHDIGKFNLGFQARADGPAELHRGHVREVLALFGAGNDDSQRLADALGIDEIFGWVEGEEGVLRLLIASIAHHGKPQRIDEAPEGRLWREDGRLSPWEGIARLARQVRRWFPDAFSTQGRPFPESAALSHAFSGLVTLADWLGSSREAFPYREDADEDRFAVAQRAAAGLFSSMGLDPRPARGSTAASVSPFARISDHPPRPAQTAVLESIPSGPGSLAILEAETGSGKTEAALARFVQLFQRGLVDGLYFALPTRTAATQIHRRVVEAVCRAFPEEENRPPVTLAVPGYLQVDDQTGKRLPGFEVLWNDEPDERWRFRGWAAESSKRYLAGAVVVGTIDQVLLSTLMIGHAHLRATALLRHLLVVDEVHASDAYMNRLLQAAIDRHLAAGGHAFLMSATLGTAARQRLLGQRTVGTLAEARLAPYPALHCRDGNGPVQTVAVRRTGDEKRVRVEARGWIGNPAAVAAFALAAAAEGARVLVIRNTVRDCVATQRELERLGGERAHLLFSCAGVPAPHHARFARTDRILLDGAIEGRFGRNASPGGCVTVATQTVEQSLDIDADLLVTDLCPVDVLLQRIGRLHRHRERHRPATFAEPRALVLVPEQRDLGRLIGGDGAARGQWGLGSVYGDLRILESTWRSILRWPFWSIPSMNRELVEVCTHPEALAAIVDELGGPWSAHAVSTAGKAFAHIGQAGLNLVDWSSPFGEVLFPSDELGRRIASRLGDEDRRAVFAQPLPGPFGSPVSELVIPARLSREASADELPREVEVGAGTIRFRFGNETFLYDRWGLRRQADENKERTDG